MEMISAGKREAAEAMVLGDPARVFLLPLYVPQGRPPGGWWSSAWSHCEDSDVTH